MQPGRYGILDLGTNSARLLIADVTEDGAWRRVASHRIPCRLGEGLTPEAGIRPDVAERTARALAALGEKAQHAGCTRWTAAATQALREARNGPDVRRRLEQALGGPLRVLSGDEEARLVLRAARHRAGPEATRACVALDLGGGSLEIARQAPDDAAARVVSLRLGAVVVGGETWPRGVVPPAQLAASRARIGATLEREAAAFRRADGRVFAAGGTAVVAARLLHADTDPPGIERPALEELLHVLASQDEATRRAEPAIADRADIIVAGMAVLCETLRFLDAARCEVLVDGVREGLLLDLAGAA